MKKENFNIALNHIDYDLVEEYVIEKVIISTKHAAIGANFIKVRLCTTLFCILSFSATYSSTRS